VGESVGRNQKIGAYNFLKTKKPVAVSIALKHGLCD